MLKAVFYQIFTRNGWSARKSLPPTLTICLRHERGIHSQCVKEQDNAH